MTSTGTMQGLRSNQIKIKFICSNKHITFTRG